MEQDFKVIGYKASTSVVKCMLGILTIDKNSNEEI